MKVQSNDELTAKLKNAICGVMMEEKCEPETGLTSLSAAFMSVAIAFAMVRGNEPIEFVKDLLNTMSNQANNFSL